MLVLKKKIQLKISIPQKKEEPKKISLKDSINNKSSLSKITDIIYTSGYLVAKDISFLINNNFTHVINCSKGSSMESPDDGNNYNKAPDIKYYSIYLRDDPGLDIINCFFQIIDYIEIKEFKNINNNNKKILIHCIEGVSRAPALIAGYLMWKNNLTTEKAIETIKSKRKCVDINLGFIIQLHKWEKYLFSEPDKIQVFKLGENIKLLEDEEIMKEMLSKIKNDDRNYLIRYKSKLYYIDNIEVNKENIISEIQKLNINGNKINGNDMKMQFIYNVIKYDKSLLNNDISSLIVIDKNSIPEKISSFEEIIKAHDFS